MTSTQQRQAIVDAVDRAFDTQVEFTRQILALPSLRGEESAAEDLIEARMRALGLVIDRWKLDPDEIAQHPGAGAVGVPYDTTEEVVVGTAGAVFEGARSLILNGHLDVVPVGDRTQWAWDTFPPTAEGDWLYGRGAGDMKSGLVAKLFALESLHAAGLRPAGR